MWKVIKWILTTLWALSSTFAAYVFYKWLEGKTGEIQNLPRFISLLSGNKLVLVLSLLVLGILAIISFQRDARQELERKVWFYKSTSRLKPTDINPSHAWYDPFFVERPAVAAGMKILASGQGLILIGVPLVGKTRCAYEVLKRLPKHYVLGIRPQNLDVANIKVPRSYLIFKPRLVLFLDDLQLYLEKVDPAHFSQHLLKQTGSFAVLATCRSGKELDSVQQDKTFSSFINQNLQEVHPEELSKGEEQVLAKHFRRDWNEVAFNGTPGSIVFDLEVMRRSLETSGLFSKTLMRSMYLMRKAGLDVYRKTLVEQVAKAIYELKTDRLGLEGSWHWLEEAGFLASEKKHITVPTHAVYLGSAFCPDYDSGDVMKDLERLWQLVMKDGQAQEIYDISLSRIIQQKFDKKAEQGLRKYLKLDPGNASAHYFLGAVLTDLDQPEEAEKQFHETIRLSPSDAKGHTGLGTLFQDQEKYEEAEREFHEALRAAPNDAHIYYLLGNLFHVQKRYKEAEKEFREAIRLDPGHASTHFELGATLHHLNSEKDAENEYLEAIRLDPNHSYSHFALGILFENRGRLETAEMRYREAIRCGNESAQSRLVRVLKKQGRTEEAEGLGYPAGDAHELEESR
jgi:Flp pilus assembly protein TadD